MEFLWVIGSAILFVVSFNAETTADWRAWWLKDSGRDMLWTDRAMKRAIFAQVLTVLSGLVLVGSIIAAIISYFR